MFSFFFIWTCRSAKSSALKTLEQFCIVKLYIVNQRHVSTFNSFRIHEFLVSIYLTTNIWYLCVTLRKATSQKWITSETAFIHKQDIAFAADLDLHKLIWIFSSTHFCKPKFSLVSQILLPEILSIHAGSFLRVKRGDDMRNHCWVKET